MTITSVLGLLAVFGRGVITGLAVAVPTGPVNVAVIRNGISRSMRLGILVGTGGAIVDGVYALLAYYGLAPLVARVRWVEPVLAAIGCVILVGYGLTSVWRPVTGRHRGRAAPTAGLRALGLGMVLTIANPGPLLAWIGIAGATMVGLTSLQALVFAVAVVLGGVLWFVLLSWLAYRGQVKFGARAVWVTRFVGVLLIGFGVYLGVRATMRAIEIWG